MTLEEAAIENGWARIDDGGQLVWRADEVHPGEVWDAAVAAERERMCAAIKAADDKASEGDYMLSSDDCISVIRGTWSFVA